MFRQVKSNNSEKARTKACRAVSVSLFCFSTLLLSACSTQPKKDANKNLFEQALILQQVQGSQPINISSNVHSHSLNWEFPDTQMQLSVQQKRALYDLCLLVDDFSMQTLRIDLGPDWLSSHTRGKHIRLLVPRGINIQQTYKPQMKAGSVVLTLVREADTNNSSGAIKNVSPSQNFSQNQNVSKSKYVPSTASEGEDFYE